MLFFSVGVRHIFVARPVSSLWNVFGRLFQDVVS